MYWPVSLKFFLSKRIFGKTQLLRQLLSVVLPVQKYFFGIIIFRTQMTGRAGHVWLLLFNGVLKQLLKLTAQKIMCLTLYWNSDIKVSFPRKCLHEQTILKKAVNNVGIGHLAIRRKKSSNQESTSIYRYFLKGNTF